MKKRKESTFLYRDTARAEAPQRLSTFQAPRLQCQKGEAVGGGNNSLSPKARSPGNTIAEREGGTKPNGQGKSSLFLSLSLSLQSLLSISLAEVKRERGGGGVRERKKKSYWDVTDVIWV